MSENTATHTLETGDTIQYDPRTTEAGTRVRVLRQVETREAGDDDAREVIVPAGTIGYVLDYVQPWFDSLVLLENAAAVDAKLGGPVWIAPDDIEFLEPITCQHCSAPIALTDDYGWVDQRPEGESTHDACQGATSDDGFHAPGPDSFIERSIVVTVTFPDGEGYPDADDATEKAARAIGQWLTDARTLLNPAHSAHAEIRDSREVIDPEFAQDWQRAVDAGDAEPDDWYPRPAGLPLLTVDDVRTLARALTDAADYRFDHGDFCGDCARLRRAGSDPDAQCVDHTNDDRKGNAYMALLARFTDADITDHDDTPEA